MASQIRARAIRVAASRGSAPSARARSSVSRVLARMRSSMAANAWAWVPPCYSIAAQMTAPAFAMKSGTLRTRWACIHRSAASVAGMFAP